MQLMPGILPIEAGGKSRLKAEPKSRDEDRLILHLTRLSNGEHDAGVIQKKLHISDTTMRRMIDQYKKGGRFRKLLNHLGITYRAKRGNGGYRYFFKGKSGGNG